MKSKLLNIVDILIFASGIKMVIDGKNRLSFRAKVTQKMAE